MGQTTIKWKEKWISKQLEPKHMDESYTPVALFFKEDGWCVQLYSYTNSLSLD